MSTPKPTKSQYLRFIGRENLHAIATLLISVLLAFLGWFFLSAEEERHRQGRFDLHVSDVLQRINTRLKHHEQILLGGAGLFDASKVVDRDEWHTYVTRLRLAENYPGILGVGFSELIKPAELRTHIDQIRSEGFPKYAIRPEGQRAIYTSVIFLEPFSGRNLAAFGYDMASEPTRAKAMWRAAESGKTAITGKVKLVQENQGKVQAGFLMYVPVYHKNMPVNTSAERRRALFGFTYSPYRVNDLMDGVMEGAATELDFRIFDGEFEKPDAEIYNSADTGAAKAQSYPAKDFHPLHTARHTLTAYGNTWTILFFSRPEFESIYSSQLPMVVLAMGSGIGVLLFLLLSSAIWRRDLAIHLAEEMTTEMRAYVKKLKASEERFDLAVKGANDGIWDRNLLTNEMYYSPRFTELLGLSPGALGTQFSSFLQRLHPDDQAPTLAAIDKHLKGAASYDVEYRLLVNIKDKHEWRWFNSRGSAVYDSNGIAVRMVGSLSDISERRRVDQMKTEFVSTVSHELRTPLTSISGSLSLISQGVLGDVPIKMQPMIDIAFKNSVRLSHIINDLLDMEKLVAGKMHFDFQVHELMPMIEHAMESIRSYGAQFKVSFTLAERVDKLAVRVDHERLQQVLSNLFSNAAKFSPVGGQVMVAVTLVGNAVRVSVSDQGAGIPEQFFDRIFQKFSQVDSSDTREKGGTGLGLAISKEMVERMNGQIGFTSELGQGSCFYFSLPQWKG